MDGLPDVIIVVADIWLVIVTSQAVVVVVVVPMAITDVNLHFPHFNFYYYYNFFL